MLRRSRLLPVVLVCAGQTGWADDLSSDRFADLLAIARSQAGQASFVDARSVERDNQRAVNFLFRTEKGQLLNVVIASETSQVLSTSGKGRATPERRGFLSNLFGSGARRDDGREARDSSQDRDRDGRDGQRGDQGSDRNGDRGRDEGGRGR